MNLEMMTRERDILIAALQEISERHEPFLDVLGIEQCGQCSLNSHYYVSYPCPDVGIIRMAMKKLDGDRLYEKRQEIGRSSV